MASLNGGDYRVTVTRVGHLEFQPPAADLSQSIASATIEEPPPVAPPPSDNPVVGVLDSEAAAPLSSSLDLSGIDLQSGPLIASDIVSGSNFYVPAQTLEVPAESLMAVMASNGPVFYNDSEFLKTAADAPEPTTFAMITGALLIGVVIRRRTRTPLAASSLP